MLTREEETELRMLSSITLAFLGDAVYELLVRDQLSRESAPAGKLHQKAVRQVCCSAQAAGFLGPDLPLRATAMTLITAATKKDMTATMA